MTELYMEVLGKYKEAVEYCINELSVESEELLSALEVEIVDWKTKWSSLIK